MECKNLLISQLKEELLANQKNIEAALNELRMKDSLIQKLVSSSKPPCNLNKSQRDDGNNDGDNDSNSNENQDDTRHNNHQTINSPHT